MSMKVVTDDEVKAFLSVCVPHTRYKIARKHILHAMSTAGWEDPICPCIYGNPGAGKTFLSESIRNEFSPVESDELTKYSVLLVTMTDIGTVEEIYKALLEAMSIDISKYKEKELKPLVYKQLIVCKVKLIIIDEFHHLLKSEKTANIRVCNAIKSITDVTKVPVALIGVEKGTKLFRINPELASRYTEPYELSPMGLDPDNRGISYFSSFLAKKMEHFPVPSVDISKNDIPYRFLLASGGDLRVIKKLWRTALTLKSLRLKPKLTLKDYEIAYGYVANRKLFTPDGNLIRPFTDDILKIKRALGIV